MIGGEVGFGQFYFQEIFTTGEVQHAGFVLWTFALLQDVDDVLTVVGLVVKRILDGSCHWFLAVGFNQGKDAAYMRGGLETLMFE